MREPKQVAHSQAVRDYRRARQKAALQIIFDRLRGRPTELLSYEQVQDKLRARPSSSKKLREIPLNSIVGSVGRYGDFTRSFLPRDASDEQRWARVKAMAEDLQGLPPIDVYKIGEAYFVSDGHHRVSVAREFGAATIEAYVTEVSARVAVTAEDEARDVILKGEYTHFLQRTELDKLRPEAEIRLTEPGKYEALLEHIDVHRYFMGIERSQEVPYGQAVVHWYDSVYLPVVHSIRQQGILRDFPGRTEADLYLWVMEHREQLRESLGWEVTADQAAESLAFRHGRTSSRVVGRVGERIREAIVPEELDGGPPAGDWRRQVVSRRTDDRLFRDILVPVSGDDAGWQAVEQAITIARREGGRMLGLHVLVGDAEEELQRSRRMRERFQSRCEESEIPGQMIAEFGEISVVIAERARWTDLVVLSLQHPPGESPSARLSSGLSKLIRRCPRPLLIVPNEATELAHPLLAYDGSPKAREALFVAAYAASAWGLPLTVLSVQEDDGGGEAALREAQGYLDERGVEAEFVLGEGELVRALLELAEAKACDLLLLGGYGANPVLEAVLGSSVDQVLRRSTLPLLICR